MLKLKGLKAILNPFWVLECLDPWESLSRSNVTYSKNALTFNCAFSCLAKS